MADPTPAQLAKARAIARRADLRHGPQCRQIAEAGWLCSCAYAAKQDALTTAIAAALADEAQQARQLCDGSCDIALARRQVGPDGVVPGNARECAELWEREASRLWSEAQQRKAQLADAEQRGRQAGLREALAYATERLGAMAQRRKRIADSEERNRLCARQEEIELAYDRLRHLAEEGPSR